MDDSSANSGDSSANSGEWWAVPLGVALGIIAVVAAFAMWAQQVRAGHRGGVRQWTMPGDPILPPQALSRRSSPAFSTTSAVYAPIAVV